MCIKQHADEGGNAENDRNEKSGKSYPHQQLYHKFMAPFSDTDVDARADVNATCNVSVQNERIARSRPTLMLIVILMSMPLSSVNANDQTNVNAHMNCRM